MKSIGTLLIATVGLLAGIASAQTARTTEPGYGEILNACLATPHANLVECARVAAGESSRGTLFVNQEITLNVGEPDAVGGGVVVCPPYGPCEQYMCRGDQALQQSVCDFLGQCGAGYPGLPPCGY